MVVVDRGVAPTLPVIQLSIALAGAAGTGCALGAVCRPTLPSSGYRGEGKGRLKSLSPGGPNGIPVFTCLTDFRENMLRDVITKLEPDLFLTVTGLTVTDFHLLVRRKVFNTEQMNQAVFAFRRCEDASLRYTGVDSHQGLAHYGLYDTVLARE